MTSAPPTTRAACRNCGQPVERRYCPECGQTTALHPPHVGEFLREFVGHHVAFEGSLWRTLAALLVTPGRLTTDYFAGRRQRYIAPLRLYLTVSLILFAVSGFVGHGLKLGNESFDYRMPAGPEHAAPAVAAPVDAGSPGGEGLVDRTVSRISSMTPEERSVRVTAGVRQYLPYVLIVLVPILALLLKLAYRSRAMRYGEHLVVAFHAQTVAFIVSIFSAIPLGASVDSLWVVVLVVHGAIALRRVYGGGWPSTIARELLVLLVYSIVVSGALAAVAMLSLVL